MTEEKKQELATRIMAEIQPEIDKLIEERDAARARAFRLAHLLRLVEDDISDAHTLGMVRAELEAEPAQDAASRVIDELNAANYDELVRRQ